MYEPAGNVRLVGLWVFPFLPFLPLPPFLPIARVRSTCLTRPSCPILPRRSSSSDAVGLLARQRDRERRRARARSRRPASAARATDRPARPGTDFVGAEHVRRGTFGARLAESTACSSGRSCAGTACLFAGEVVQRREQPGLLVVVVVALRPDRFRQRRILLVPRARVLAGLQRSAPPCRAPPLPKVSHSRLMPLCSAAMNIR